MQKLYSGCYVSMVKLQNQLSQFLTLQTARHTLFSRYKTTPRRFLKTEVIFLLCMKNILWKFQVMTLVCSPFKKWNQSEDFETLQLILRYMFVQSHCQYSFTGWPQLGKTLERQENKLGLGKSEKVKARRKLRSRQLQIFMRYLSL